MWLTTPFFSKNATKKKTYTVSIKWGKNKYDDVLLDTTQSALDFKVLVGSVLERKKNMM